MASDLSSDGRKPGKRSPSGGFRWVSSSPSPAEVECLEQKFPDVVSLPVSEIEEELMLWKQRAAILRSFHRWIPAEAYIREFRRAGITGPICPISLAFRCHVFYFESAEACSAVLDRPWIINGQSVGAEEWRPEFFPASDSIPTALGGFARVCIRVDLRLPLRPGVRIQGTNRPFWQQLSYEGLDGVCFKCGSLHLDGPCVMSGGTEEPVPASVPEFGPWLVASRQWKPATAPPQPQKGKATFVARSNVPAGPSSSTAERCTADLASGRPNAGWVTPARASRRKPLRSSTIGVDAPFISPAGCSSGVKAMKHRAPVPVLQRAGPSLDTVPTEKLSGVSVDVHSKSEGIQLTNPFALLAAADEGVSRVVVRDVCPGPLKRARPEDPSFPRSKLALGNRKGTSKGLKLKSGGKAPIFPNQQDLIPVDLNTEICNHPSKVGHDGGPKDPALISGDLVQSPCLTDPELGQSSHMIEDGSLVSGFLSDNVMVDDQGGGPCPPQTVQ